MANFNLLFALVSFVITISFASGNPILADRGREHKNVINGVIRPESLFLIGMINGKGFFGDRTIMTWQEANAYCENMSMKLASIITQEEADFLKRAWSSGTFDGGFWTSAKDARQLRQFSWKDKTQPGDFWGGKFHFHGYDITSERCLSYYSGNGDAYFDSYPCTEKRAVMCDSG